MGAGDMPKPVGTRATVKSGRRGPGDNHHRCGGRGVVGGKNVWKRLVVSCTCMACGKKRGWGGSRAAAWQPGSLGEPATREGRNRPDLTSARPKAQPTPGRPKTHFEPSDPEKLILEDGDGAQMAACFGPFHQQLPSLKMFSAGQEMSSFTKDAADATVRLF